jgi:hypothetical protein
VQLAASTITTRLPCFISCQAAVQQSLSQELCDLVRAHLSNLQHLKISVHRGAASVIHHQLLAKFCFGHTLEPELSCWILSIILDRERRL